MKILRFKKLYVIGSYLIVTLVIFQTGWFSAVSYSKQQYYPGDCVEYGKAMFWKVSEISEDYYYVNRCYEGSDFVPPHCSDKIWEIPAEEFENIVQEKGGAVMECPNGTRIAIYDGS